MARPDDIRYFYEILAAFEHRLGGKRLLDNSHGRMAWPQRGVYFFFEPGELRTTSGIGLRVVRVGTHALKAGSKSTLWGRLSQHQGTQKSGAGNHRGSVFRLHVGTALIERDGWSEQVAGNWGRGSNAKKDIRQAERPLEQAVSQHIRSMPFLWLEVDDPPGPNSLRGYLERNAIALLSNYVQLENPIDPPSQSWLGRYSKSQEIHLSGLWNVNHVRDQYDPGFLNLLREFVTRK